jgi:hypothetical protein
MNTNNKPLKIFDKQELYHYVDGVKTLGKNPEMEGNCSGLRGDCTGLQGICTGLRGICTGLRGDCTGLRGICTGLRGDCTGLQGDCTGLWGDLDLITTKQREENSYILFYGEVQS